MPTHTQLKGVTNFGDSLLSDQLENNLFAFFTWGLLGIGGWTDVRIPSSGAFGGAAHRLRPVTEDPYYTPGQVWEGFRQDWVWESGVEYAFQPIHVSGVYVNGDFVPLAATGVYAHKVNYPLGRVVFETPLDPSGDMVTCEYSYRYCQFSTSDVPWWRQIQQNSLRIDDPQFLEQGSGAWSVLAQNRVQLPAVVIEAVSNARRKPFEVGSQMQIVSQDVLFHVIAETPWDKKQLHDVITYQTEKRLQGFDKNLLLAADQYPLDADGTPVSGALMYPDLVKPTGQGGFQWNQIRIMSTRAAEQPASVTAPLYYATVRAAVEVDLP
jgi:hypothetical protein